MTITRNAYLQCFWRLLFQGRRFLYTKQFANATGGIGGRETLVLFHDGIVCRFIVVRAHGNDMKVVGLVTKYAESVEKGFALIFPLLLVSFGHSTGSHE